MTGSESAEVAAIVASGDSAGLPASDLKSSEERHSQRDTKKPQEKMREAAEVYLLMHRNCRVSRNIRANWYFEHLDKPVQIYSGPNDMSNEMLVYGMTPVDGADEEHVGNEQLLFTRNTKMIFFAKLYRQVYVLDLSPSTLVADDEAGCCLFTLLIEHFKACLYSLTRQMVLPGKQLTLRPAIYLTVLVYTPYLTFEEKTVLVQGTLVNHLNVHLVVEDVEIKFKKIVHSLHKFSQPIVDAWGKKNEEKKRQRTYRSFPSMAAPSTPPTGILKEKTAVFREEIDGTDYEDEDDSEKDDDDDPPGSRTRLPSDSEMAMELEEMGYTRQQWSDVSGEATATDEGGAVFANASSLPPVEGYIHPEWSLIYMIRMAILAIQMLPENTQSNIIVITDAVCGMPEPSALHDLLSTLRSFSIACSFIQVQGRVHSEPSFGHVASCELFHFLAVATFGAYLPNCKCILADVKKGLNTYQKQLMCFWFEKALQKNNHILSIVRDVNEMFADMYLNDLRRHAESRLCYECSIRDLMYVRLREGYTVKEIRESPRKTVIVLILPIRQLSCIEYTITAKGPMEYKKRQVLKAEVTLIAPYNVLQELIAAPTTANPTRQKAVRAYRDIIDGIVESDRILTHLHSFFTQRSYYTIPEGLSHCAMGLFRREDPPPTKLELHPEFFTRPRFDKFWCQLIDIEERIWQKWTHTHQLRLLLTPNEEVCGVFTNRNESLDFKKSIKILRQYLAKQASFCLLQDQIYVFFVGGGSDSPPRQFYLLRVTGQPPLISLRVSFIGGMTNHIRVDIIRRLSEDVSKLRFVRGRKKVAITEENSIFAATLLKRPMERLIVTYKGIPSDVHSMIAHTSSSDMIPSVSEHNALAKFMQARRIIWKLASMFCDRGGDLPPQVSNYFTDMMLRRRLALGYQLIWMKHGIVGLCRQMEAERPETSLDPSEDMVAMSEESRVALEQFVIFPPMHERSEIERIAVSIDDVHPQGCPAKNVDVVIVQEMWLEPGAMTDQACRLIAEEVLLSSLFTVDKLLRICAIGGVAAPVRTFAKHSEGRDGTETRLIQFSLGSLMRNSQRHLMLLPFHCLKGVFEQDLKRAQMLMDILHEQLRENSECTLEVTEKHKWSDMVGDLERQTDYYADMNRGTKFVMYMRKTSPWSVVGVAIPSEKEKVRDWRDGALPLLFFSSAEPAIALAAMTGGGGVQYIEDRRKTDAGGGPEPADVPDDFVLEWRGTTEGGGFKSFNLTSYVRNMYDHLIMKSMVTCMFKAVNEGILVSDRALQDVTEEHCDFINLEVEGVDDALRTICSHLRTGQTPSLCPHPLRSRDSSDKCNMCSTSLNALPSESSDDVDFELSFSSLLSRYFIPVAGSPSYFHYISRDSPMFSKMGNGRYLNRLAPSMLRRGRGDLLNYSSDDEEEYLYYRTGEGKIMRKPEDIFPVRMYSVESSDESLTGSMDNLLDINGEEMTPLGEKRPKFESRDQYPTPIFLYFSCGVRLPTGEMETFPINSFPSCIHHIIKRANLPLLNYNIDDVRVSLDLYILTWPVQLDAHTAGTEGAGYAAAKRKTFLQLLPSRERAVIERLSHSISYLIEQEMVLMDSRRRELSLDRIERISNFISREMKEVKEEKDGRYDAMTKRLGLVISSPEAKERLKERLHGILVDYSMLKRVGDSDLFYACRVVDSRRFARHFVKEVPPPPIIITPQMRRAMKEEERRREKMEQEEKVKAIKKDVMRSLGYREDASQLIKAREEEEEALEEMEREEKKERRRVRVKRPKPPLVPAFPVEKKEGESEEKVVMSKAEELKKKIQEKKMEEAKKKKEEEERREAEEREKEDAEDDSEAADIIVPLPEPLDPEAERLRQLQELHEPQIPMGRRRIVDMDSLDLTKKDVMCDFWVIVRITDQIHIQFAQRYAHFRHTLIFDETWRKIKRALKVTNQQMLLEKAHETMEVNSLLLISDRERREYGSECIDGSIEPDPDSIVLEDNSRDQVTESARFYYTPGSFACPMVHHHWFVVPPRLKTCIPKHQRAMGQTGIKTRDPPETTAIDVLRTALHAFAASNVENVYLFKDRLGAVFYMHLHVDIESVEKMSKSVPENIKKEADNGQFSTNVLLAVHGVDRPNEEITIDLPDMLQRQLNASHLDKIIGMFAKNKKAILEQSDVLFIQPEPRRPSRIYHFSVPDAFANAKLMAAFDFYVRQHLTHEWPEVRYRSSRGTAIGSVDRLAELRMMSCAQMSITPTIDEPPKEDEVEESERGTEEVSEIVDGNLAVSIPIPFTGGRNTATDEGERQEILEIMGIAETPVVPEEGSETTKTVKSAPEVKRERALRKLSGHIYRGKKSFEAHTSVMTPKLPPTYHPKFNVICKPKGPGSNAYGFAVAELRLMGTSGSVIDPGETELTDTAATALFDTTEVGVRQFEQLTRSDRAEFTAHKRMERLKHGRFSRFFKNEKLEKFEHTFMVELVVWEMGDVGDDYVKNATLAFIRQALVDCVTEYWMFTRALVDKPAKPQDDTSPMKPAASQPMEIPQEKEPPRAVSLSLDDAILVSNSSGSYGAAGGEPCCKSEGAPAFICGDFEIRREQAIPGMTGALIHVLNWFDFVSSSVKKTAVKGGVKMMAVQKNEVECASVEGATKVIDVIKRLLSGNRYARSDSYPDDVRVCVRLPGTGEGSNKKEDTFPGAIKDQWEGIQSDLGVDLDECPPEEPPSVVVVAFSIAVWEDSIRYSRGADGPPPDSLQEMKHEDKREQFMPRFPNDTRRSYIPRLRFVTVTLTGKKVTLYSYNLRHDLHTMMVDDLRTAVQWHEAKMLLLRQIGLHKMGITHLAPTQDLPYDEGGTYATRIWRCTESYLESDFPPGHSCEITPKECILSMSRLYRGIEPAFVTAGIETCFIDDQFFQLKQIRQAARSQLLPHHYLSALHARMMVGKDKITYADLCELVNASRETHFVMTPILLFPKWRRKIAGIRAPEKERERVRNSTAKTRNASTASGFGMKGTSSARGRTVSTLSVSNSHASGLSLPPSGKSPSLRVVQLGEEDDPLHRQLEVKLLSEYVEYLISLGMKPVTIDRRTARTGRQPTGGSIVRWNLHPEQWMVTAVDGGLLLAHLCFTPPYFHVRFRMWHLLGVFSTVEDDHEKLKMRNLERAKDELVAACHVHSFTYDFHLRMLSKYLLGRDHILFMPGYNTSAFLIDFLQYYGCRPPCARNCIYEERTSFSLQHGVHAEDVWAHFLKHDKLYGWRVVKMKQSEDDFYHHQAEFMLVQTAVDMHGERDEVKIVIHERSLLSPHSLNLAIYMIVVNKSHKTPLSDERRREDSRASEGEFKHVAPFNLPPAVPSKEGSERAEERTEDGDSGSRDSGAGSSAVALPGLVSEIERMVILVNEGLLPSVVDGSLSRRRRFSSDGNVAGGLTLPTDQNIPIVLTPRSGDSDSLGSIGSLTSPPSPSVKVPPTENQLAIQVNAPRRHRRREESRVDGAGLPIAQERAIYVHFLSARQRKLQKIVEDATTKYRLQLQKCVQDAEFACRRDTLWQRIVAMPRHPVKTSSVGFFRTVNTDPWQVARTAAVRGKDPSKDLDTLISIVHKEKMADREPGLAQLTRGLKAAGLCRHLVARFGVERCRFFENKHAVNKKGLLITNPNCLLDAAILVSCTKETSPELIMMIKEYDDDETVNEQVKKFKQAAIDTAFDEVVSTVIAYVWATLNTRMELP